MNFHYYYRAWKDKRPGNRDGVQVTIAIVFGPNGMNLTCTGFTSTATRDYAAGLTQSGHEHLPSVNPELNRYIESKGISFKTVSALNVPIPKDVAGDYDHWLLTKKIANHSFSSGVQKRKVITAVDNICNHLLERVKNSLGLHLYCAPRLPAYFIQDIETEVNRVMVELQFAKLDHVKIVAQARHAALTPLLEAKKLLSFHGVPPGVLELLTPELILLQAENLRKEGAEFGVI